jgi:hypothetical protein
MTTKTVEIDVLFLASLLTDSVRLYALERGGVDNWEWYDESLDPFRDTLNNLDDISSRLKNDQNFSITYNEIIDIAYPDDN